MDSEKQHDFIDYEKGADYAGAEKLLQEEWAYLEEYRESFDKNNIKGIALSGGGIRSASFCLGVLQALASENKLERFDYLSSVSGGGYLAGALNWLWSGLWREPGSKTQGFGVGKHDFPFGTEGRRFNSNDKQGNRRQASLLRHLRQNGKYLVPGKGITALSFFSIILRSLVMGFIALMILAGFLFSVFYQLQIFEPDKSISVFFRGVGGVTLILGFVGLQILYVLMLAKHKYSGNNASGYRLRRLFERWIPLPLKIALLCYVFAAIHWVQVSFNEVVLEVGSVSAALGAVFGVLGSESKWNKLIAFIPQSIKVVIGAALMLFGLLVLADLVVNQLVLQYPYLYMAITAGSALLLVAIAYFLPINNISIHRYYRDRLMETFMPDAEKVFRGEDCQEAIRSNRTGVHELGLGDRYQAPYPLINTNVILVESEIAKFRGRGGDNFILSPLYSGSNATGWRRTREFCDGNITLPTAVAISGAAANPDAGVAGRGLTTNAVISILMSIFNLRLGYWASNPNPDREYAHNWIPNYFNPGFVEILEREDMNETAPLVQLSDGGHFENLALYELFRRRARLIVICDAAADPAYEFADLANAIEKARVDFGVSVHLDKTELDKLVPAIKPEQSSREYAVAEKSYLMADVDYHDGSKTPAKLIYIKTTLWKDISADIHGYKRAHADFPDETTVDQFFDEVQFEAYRELGWQIAHSVMEDDEVKAIL